MILNCFVKTFHPSWSVQLLRKCVEGYTQNANEALNGVIWKLCPKTGNHGLTTVNTAPGIGVSLFNDGASALGVILKKTGLACWGFHKRFPRDERRYAHSKRTTAGKPEHP